MPPTPIPPSDLRVPIVDEVDQSTAVLRRSAHSRRSLALADALSAVVALVVSVDLLGDDTLRVPALVTIPLVILLAKVAGLYDRDELVLDKSTLEEAPKLFHAATLYTLLVWLGQDVFINGTFGRTQVLGVWGLLFACAVSGRTLARVLVRTLNSPERCLLIGDADAALRFATKLSDRTDAQLVGRLPSHEEAIEPDMPSPLGPLGDLEELEAVVREHEVHRVVLAPDTLDSEPMIDTIRRVKSLGVHVSVLPRMLEVLGSSVEFDQVDGMPVLGVRRFGLTKSSARVKRLFDVVGASVLLVLLAPLMGAFALAVRLSSPGPVFFRQRRVGRDGQVFEILKFRTMLDGADAMKARLQSLNEAGYGLFKITNDPRITRVGRILRRTSLDELPQLWNVLRGEMSLVGPRPLVEDEDRRIELRHRKRLHLKPGMTGHWQVLGSSRIPLREMVTIDYLYIANWSLWVDAKILVRTAAHVLGGRGR